MKRRLQVSLAVTVLLSAAALWTEQGPSTAAAVADRPELDRSALTRNGIGVVLRTEESTADLPWGRSLLEPASRDLFANGTPAPPAPMATAAPPVSVASEPVVMPTSLPQYRFLGRMVTPQGQQMVYLGGQGDQAVAIKTGDRLEDGWVVDHLDQEAIHLLYPPTQQRVVVSVAPSDQ